jgi:hypothetical protein
MTHRAGCAPSVPGCACRTAGFFASGILKRLSMVQSTLSEIVTRNRYDTDKSDEYLKNYERTFAHLRTNQIALMEVGVNRGGSLYMWRDYFTRGTIVGIDRVLPADFIDPSGRCRMFQSDQADPSAMRAIAASAAPGGFHIIIDDASHLGEATASTFRALFYDHLQPGGWYSIEDWGTGYWDGWPDGGAPEQLPSEPRFRHSGKHFQSHDLGMVGFIKQLVDECGFVDSCPPHLRLPPVRQLWIRSMHVSAGLVIIEKAQG